MKKLVFLFIFLFALSFSGIAQTEYLVSKDGNTVVKAVDTEKYTFDHYIFNDSLYTNQNLDVIKAKGGEVNFNFNFKQYDGFHRKYKPNKTAWLDTKTKRVKIKTHLQKDLFAWEIIVFFLLTFMSALMLTVYKKKTSIVSWYKLIFLAFIVLLLYLKTQDESKTIIIENLVMIAMFTFISFMISIVIAINNDMNSIRNEEDYLIVTSIFNIIVGIFLVWLSTRYWAWALTFSAYPIVFIIKENWIGKIWKKIFHKKEKEVKEKNEKIATE